MSFKWALFTDGIKTGTTTKAKIICLITLLSAVSSSTAGLIVVDDVKFGVGSITRDTTNKVEWLDLTLSTNRTFEFVEGQLVIGGAFQGFRHASAQEITGLWTSAGIPNIGTSSFVNIAPSQALMNLIGSTSFQGGIGNGKEAIGIGKDGLRSDLDAFLYNGNPVMGAFIEEFEWKGRSAGTVGHWLVRDVSTATPVPEPTTLLLAVGGIGFVGIAHQRRKSKYAKSSQ